MFSGLRTLLLPLLFVSVVTDRSSFIETMCIVMTADVAAKMVTITLKAMVGFRKVC